MPYCILTILISPTTQNDSALKWQIGLYVADKLSFLITFIDCELVPSISEGISFLIPQQQICLTYAGSVYSFYVQDYENNVHFLQVRWDTEQTK